MILGLDILVEVVPDPRAMREQVLDGHVVRDEREIVAEKRARGRRELERAVLDETHDGERGQPFTPLAIANRVSVSFGIS